MLPDHRTMYRGTRAQKGRTRIEMQRAWMDSCEHLIERVSEINDSTQQWCWEGNTPYRSRVIQAYATHNADPNVRPRKKGLSFKLFSIEFLWSTSSVTT